MLAIPMPIASSNSADLAILWSFEGGEDGLHILLCHFAR